MNAAYTVSITAGTDTNTTQQRGGFLQWKPPCPFLQKGADMIIFKILKTILDLLPWALLAVLLYAVWPYLRVVMHLVQSVHNFLH